MNKLFCCFAQKYIDNAGKPVLIFTHESKMNIIKQILNYIPENVWNVSEKTFGRNIK